jgi:hypothetical protein
MKFEDALISIGLIIGGCLMVVFSKFLAYRTEKSQHFWFGTEYSDYDRKVARISWIVGGIFFAVFGVLSLLDVITG